jgi:ABC-2 type transport system permease protein
MKRYFRLYWLLSLQSVKTTLQHRTGIIFFVAGKIIRFGMFFVFAFMLLKNTKVLAGYSLNETLLFFLSFNVLDTLTQMLFREVYRFRWLVASGELDGVLLRPYHPFLKILFGGLDIMDAILLGPYLLILVYFVGQVSVVSWVNWLIYALLMMNGFLIATAFHIAVLALGVLTTEVDHTIMIYRDLSRLAVVPVDIYQEPIRSLITFVLPIGIMMTFPVKGLLNMLNWNLLALSFVLGIGIMLISLWFWRLALRKYQSWGS